MSNIFGALRSALGGDNRPQVPTVDPAVTPLTPEQDAALYPEPSWLQTGVPWPPKEIKDHIDLCEENNRLFKCDFAEVFAAQYQRLKDIENYFAPVTYEQEINLFHGLTMLWRALLTAEPPQFSAGESGSPESLAVQRIARQSRLVSQIKRGVVDQSVKADAVFVVSYDARRKLVRISTQPPERWYPFVDPGDIGNKLADVLFYEEKAKEGKDEVRYINAAIHYAGLIKHRRFRIRDGALVGVDAIRRPVDPGTGEYVPEDQLTGIPVSLVHVATNICTSDEATGMSDYKAVETIVPELSVRASQWARLFDKFTDPAAYGPPLLPQDNPATGESEIKIRGRYIEMPEDSHVAPGYAVWDPQLTAAFEAWDKLMDVFYVATGSNSAAFEVGSSKGQGHASSGTALRLRLTRPMQVAADKAQELDPALTDALYAAQLLEQSLEVAPEPYTPTEPRIDWRDGLPDDPVERSTIEYQRTGGKQTTSIHSSIKRQDNLSDEEAEDELNRILEEQTLMAPPVPPETTDFNGPGAGDQGTQDGGQSGDAQPNG